MLGFKSNHSERKTYVLGFTSDREFEVVNTKTGYKAHVYFMPSGEYDTFADVEAAASRELKNE